MSFVVADTSGGGAKFSNEIVAHFIPRITGRRTYHTVSTKEGFVPELYTLWIFCTALTYSRCRTESGHLFLSWVRTIAVCRTHPLAVTCRRSVKITGD